MSDIIVNKVIKGGETYLDLTNDTVSEGTLLKNRTAHNSEGIQIQGVMEEGGGSVTGVKGDDEPAYRDGNVNITAANIGTYTTSQIDALLNNKVDAHGTDSLMTNAEHVKLAGIEAGAEENVIESISLNGEEITPVNKAVTLSVIDKDVNDLTNYYKKSEIDTSLGAKQNIVLSSTLSIGGQTVTEVEEALGSLAGISKPMTGATSSAVGEGGFVPSPSAGDENKALFGDGTWKPVSGGGGGHTILDEDGITYPQRSKLQFEGCEVTDDSANDITKIKAEGGVTGVKGNAESDYRTGNVNLTPANIGAVAKNGASTNTTVAFTSNDLAANTTAKTDTTANQPSTVAKLTSGETLGSVFGKLSSMFASVRKLWNTVGTSNLSTKLGTTVTGTVNTLNTNLVATYNSSDVPFKFGIDANGNYGYIKAGADSVTPFKSGITPSGDININSNGTFDVTNYANAIINVPFTINKYKKIMQIGGSNGSWLSDVSVNDYLFILGPVKDIRPYNGPSQGYGTLLSSGNYDKYGYGLIKVTAVTRNSEIYIAYSGSLKTYVLVFE